MTMSEKVIYNFTDRIWQVGSGAKWSNIPVAKEVDLKASACTPNKGVTPKDIYLDLSTDIGKGNKVTNASFCISIPIDRGLAKPKVEFYDGTKYGKNAPNKIKPFKTISKPTKNPRGSGEEYRNYGGFEGGTKWYKNYYNCKGITKDQLKHLIVVLKFSKATSNNAKMTIGWTKIEVKYDKDTSYELDIYSPDTNTTNKVNVGSVFKHTIKLMNVSENGAYAYYKVANPVGSSLVSTSNVGDYQNSGTYKGYYKKYLKGNSSTNVYFNYRMNSNTKYTFTDILKNKDDKGHSKSYKWSVVTEVPQERENLIENVTITPPFLYVNTDNQWIDVVFTGDYNREGALCYKWNSNDTCTDVLRGLLEMVDYEEVEKSNISSYTVNLANQRICIDPANYSTFMLHLRIKVNPTDNNDYLDSELNGYYFEGQFYEHSVYDELVRGYYYNDNFYYDNAHTELVTPQSDIYYYDLSTGKAYYFENNAYEEVVLPDSTVYFDAKVPTNNDIYLDVLNNKRFKYYDDKPIRVCSEHSKKYWTAYVDIFGEKTYSYSINDSPVYKHDRYYPMTLYTSLNGVSAIKCKSKRNCFFENMNTDYNIIVESPQAYIGCVPLTRAHQADNTANTTNGLISNSYLNRRYKGKTGEMKEDIGMELFLKPSEVATLQGLAELDKPIPLDLVPHMKDGDPLNHRGWAELYAVKNIKKLNSFTYSCEPEVDYLTHDLNTAFEIVKEANVNNFTVPYYLSMTQDFTDKLSDLMVTDYPFYSDLIDDYGFVGYYDLENNNSITFTSVKPVSKFSDWDIKWRNTLKTFTTEDLDDNFNVKIQLIKLNNNDNPTIQFEYVYDKFKHYNHTNSYTMNRFEQVVRKNIEDGIVKERKFGNLSLLPDDLTALAYNNKIATKMWVNSSTIIESNDNYFDIILATVNNNLIMGETVIVTITNDYGYYDKKKYMSDMYGRIRIPTNLEDTDYEITVEYEESRLYRPCSLKTSIDVVKNNDAIIINYLDDYTTVKNGTEVAIQVTTNRGVPLVGKSVLVDIRGSNSNHYGACINYITDSEGKIYPIVKTDGGSKIIRARYMNEDNYSANYLEQNIYVSDDYTQTISIESDDIEYEIDQPNKEYSVKLLNNETPMANEKIEFIIYNNEETIIRESYTNSNGFATIPIHLSNGVWYIDSYYEGKQVVDNEGTTTIYNPVINTNTIKTLPNLKKDTYLTSTNNIIKTENSDLYKVTLFDEDSVKLNAKPIHFIASNATDILFNGIVITDENGDATLPLYDVGANITVEALFEGDNAYNNSEIEDKVSYKYYNSDFDDTRIIKDGTDFYLEYDNGTDYTVLGNTEVLVTLNKLREVENEETHETSYVLVHSVLNNYTFTVDTTNEGKIPLPNISGDYYVNISYKGSNNSEFNASNHYDSITKDDTIERVPKIVLPDDYILDNNDYITNYQGSYGKIFKMKFNVKDNITNEFITNAYVSVTSDCFSDGYTDENGDIELEVLKLSQEADLEVTVNIDVGMLYTDFEDTYNFKIDYISGNATSVINFEYTNSELEGHEHFNYQEFRINTTTETANTENNICDYYTIKLTSIDGNESFELDNMSADKINYNYLQFYLRSGNWIMDIYAHCNDGINDSSIKKVLTITEGGVEAITELILINGESVESSIVDNFDDQKTFGSLLKLKFREGLLSVYDYGYTTNDNSTDVKISEENIKLPNDEFYLRFVVEYNNLYNIKLTNVEGLLQFKLTEDLTSSDLANTYSNMVVSPTPLPDNKCLFTRLTDDGRLYYYSYDKIKNNRYIGSPYNFYKGGTNLKTELGTEIFNFETGANPIYITNGLCKMSIHRISGYIELFVWDSSIREWYLVNVLKVKSDYTIKRESYDDDCISVTFSGVTFTMWRGRPYIEIKHNGKDIEMLNYKDRVYCEVDDNGKNMRLLEESAVGRAIFDVNTSVQRFDKALQVGQNIALDNFDLYDVSD